MPKKKFVPPLPARKPRVAGNSTTLTAIFSGGTGSINNGVGAVTSGTSVTITPATTTTYTLTVTNSAGTSVTAGATVTVVPPPAINSFSAGASTITAGNSTTLTANFTGGTGSINNGVGRVGRLDVSEPLQADRGGDTGACRRRQTEAVGGPGHLSARHTASVDARC